MLSEKEELTFGNVSLGLPEKIFVASKSHISDQTGLW